MINNLNNIKDKISKLEDRIITDSDLIKMILGSKAEDNPLIFYRSLSENPKIRNSISKPSFVIRPFSHAKPGIKRDIPLSYGTNTPLVLRIVDPIGAWEDTGKYRGLGENWEEAMNLDPVNLLKIHEGVFKASDLYRQVGRQVKDPSNIWQGTYIVDQRINPLVKSNLLNQFKDDYGFLKELNTRARKFKHSDNPHMKSLNQKYFEYFNWAKSLSSKDIKDTKTRDLLRDLQDRVSKLDNVK